MPCQKKRKLWGRAALMRNCSQWNWSLEEIVVIVSHCDFINLLGCFAGHIKFFFEKPLTIAASGQNPLLEPCMWLLSCCTAEAPSFGIWQWTCWRRTRRSNQFKLRTFRWGNVLRQSLRSNPEVLVFESCPVPSQTGSIYVTLFEAFEDVASFCKIWSQRLPKRAHKWQGM